MPLPPLADLKKRYIDRDRPLPVSIEEELRRDARSGAQQILAAIERRRRGRRSEGQRMRKIHRYEQALWSAGITLVAGVDEVGMSPLAGPVAAGAVILPVGCRIDGVDDSKKLDARAREEIAAEVREIAIAWCVAYVEPDEIDRINIYWAGLLAMRRAVEGLARTPAHLLIDARKLKDVPIPQTSIVRGDSLSASIGAASIVAKTARDALMCDYDRQYPGYGFSRHKGYPVREHTTALRAQGACPIHRRSFLPVREALGLPPLAPDHWKRPPEEAPPSGAGPMSGP